MDGEQLEEVEKLSKLDYPFAKRNDDEAHTKEMMRKVAGVMAPT